MMLPPSFSRGRRRRTAGRAFALVIVLIIVSVLALVAVGYLASMSQERATANAFGNKARAEESAQAGVDTAMGILKDYFKAFPDSATVWDTTQTKNPDGTASEGTTLYLRAVPQTNNATLPDPAPGDPGNVTANYAGGNGPNNVSTTTGADARSTFVLPLISGATVNLLANKASTVPTLTANTSTNLNARRQISDTQGWIGTPPGYTSAGSLPKPVYVPWVNVQQQDGYTGNASTAPVVGRYAFWVEDESFRANISYAGTGTAANVRRDNSANYALNPTDLNLIGTLTAIGDTDPKTVAQNLLTARGYYPGKVFPESRAYTHTSGLSTATANGLRYLTTGYSAALNLSRHGTQRSNLNDVIYPSGNAANGTVQNQIDKIVQTIQFHAPNFGQRFYRKNWSGTPPVVSSTDLDNSTMVTSAHAQIYCYKIAANLHDYIDADALPTVINAADANGNSGQVYSGGAPTKPINFNDGPNPVWAVGKDSAPVLQEAAVRFSTGPGNTATHYSVNVDYYLEFWNMSTRQITSADLAPHPYIRINDEPSWYGTLSTNPSSFQVPLTDSSGGVSLSSPPPARDGNIDLSQSIKPDGSSNGPVVFPPGSITVITTDTNYASVAPTISDPTGTYGSEAVKHYVLCATLAKRNYNGPMPAGCNSVRMLYRNGGTFAGSGTGADYETEVVVGNDNGYIESLAGAVAMSGGVISIPVGSSPRPVYGGYLRGNLAASGGTGLQPSAIGDPRTNNEQLTFSLTVPDPGSVDNTRYKNFDLATTTNGIPPTFGLPNYLSIDPAKSANPWSDYYWFPHSLSGPAGNSTATPALTAQNAPSIIANAPLLSIGQLGDVYDPARLPYKSGADITVSRGGGRSLRIGQHDDRYNNNNNNYNTLNASTGAYPASIGWASWRLTDFFGISNAIEQPGLININGLARDNGAALMAAFQGFNFQPTTLDPGASGYDPAASPLLHGDPQTAGKSFDPAGLQNLINDIITNRLKNTDLTKPGPFFERGEISETPILNPANSTSTNLVTGIDMKTVLDNGREELVRRLIELITTRGSVFTVYAVGQAINQTIVGGVTKLNVTATHQLRVTFKLVPKKSDGTLFQPAIDAPGNDFNPTDATQLNTRFSKPDHYDIQVFSVTSGNI